MPINLTLPQTTQELRPKITVVGVGGAGCNAVNNMINANLEGVDFLVVNTDGQSLSHSLAPRKIQLGSQVTQGLGAGSKPEMGKLAAEESMDEVLSELNDCNMVFITAGMGGGTGTGAAPIIAQAAKERGILTVGVVTKPFSFEGQRRMTQAEDGISALQAYVDTLIVIPNQNLFRLANERTTFADAFSMADAVLHQGVCGVTDLMIKPGIINLDFADIRSVMTEMGKAMMGTGEATGENRAIEAAEAAINNPLLDDTTMQGAQALLINITGGMDMTLFEVDEAANRIRKEVDEDATIIFGSAFDERLEGIIRVSVVATGFEACEQTVSEPVNRARGQELPNTYQTSSIPGLFSSTPPNDKDVETTTIEINKLGGFADKLSPPNEKKESTEEEAALSESLTKTSSDPTKEIINQTDDSINFSVQEKENSNQLLTSKEIRIKEENEVKPSGMTGSTEVEISSNRENKAETDTAEDKQLPDMKISETSEKAKTSFIPEPTKPLYPDASYAPIKNNTGLIGRIYQMWGSQKTVEGEEKTSSTAPTPNFNSVHKPSLSPVSQRLDNENKTSENVFDSSQTSSFSEKPKVLDLAGTPESQATMVFKEATADEDSDDLDIPAFLRRQAN